MTLPVAIAKQIRALRQRTCKDVIQIGRLLIEAKDQLGHGEWGEWLRNEFAWSQDTAERFINVAKAFGKADSATLRNLDLSALYDLARPSTPQSARDQVVELIGDKNPPSLADVRSIIRDAKAADAPKLPPQPQQPKPPTPRQAALQEQFRQAIATLQALSTKPANTFAGIATPDDLVMLSNFLRQIASAPAQQVEAA
jgi:hypothetical protein